MALVSASSSPPRLSTGSDAASSSPLISFSADSPDRSDPSSSADQVLQAAARLRSEEYRQLFRLPSDEALIDDFNCAFQENILIQGHMYLFVHHICFYSNIFGYETKKVILFQEVTRVRRAKLAGIFPNAIEIFSGDKKESISETENQDNGVVIKQADNSNNLDDETDSTDRDTDTHTSEYSELPPTVEDQSVFTRLPEAKGVTEEDIELVLNDEPSSSRDTLTWMEEDLDAPSIPEFYTEVAESQFPIKVEDFFDLFYSDDVFTESFHTSCGDKDFRCTSWQPHETVIETSQEINDVPYGDYFQVEGLWNVERDIDGSKECCNVKIYLNVAFSKRTVWKGKIVQSTLEECREVFATWINMAHELLKKNLEKQEDNIPTVSTDQKCEVSTAEEAETVQSSEKFYETRDQATIQHISASTHPKQQLNSLIEENPSDAYSCSSLLIDYMIKFGSSLKRQIHLPLIVAVIVAVIFIM